MNPPDPLSPEVIQRMAVRIHDAIADASNGHTATYSPELRPFVDRFRERIPTDRPPHVGSALDVAFPNVRDVRGAWLAALRDAYIGLIEDVISDTLVTPFGGGIARRLAEDSKKDEAG